MVKYIKCEQRSSEWYNYRLGVATATGFNKIMISASLKPSKDKYIYKLVAEKMLKGELFALNEGNTEPDYDSDQGELENMIKGFANFAMVRGRLLESTAIKAYQFQHNTIVDRSVGFILSDCERYGCSPDGLIGDDGGAEIKCPYLLTHLQYMEDETLLLNTYAHQVYGFLFITGREWIDLFSYHPKKDSVMIHITKDDEAYQKWSKSFIPCLEDFFIKFNKLYSQ